MNESSSLARYIASTSYDDLPPEAIEAAKKSILDAIGVTLAAGTLGEGCRQFVELTRSTGGKPESTIIGFNFKVPAFMAAFANGSMAHGLDFEDTHDIAKVHPNAAAIPAAIAVSESLGNVSGKELITSVSLACDVVCRLGLALTEDPIRYGWYMPQILGAFGAAAVASKLLKLNPGQILDAFSLTLCQTGGSAELIENPDSLIRAIRDAFAAKTGVISAQLAAGGITGFKKPLEGNAGLFKLFARNDFDLAKLTEDLGSKFHGSDISYKPWPSCRGTHAFIETIIKLKKEHGINPGDIESIELHISPAPVSRVLCEPLPTKQRPKTAIDAKFSIPYTAALALVYDNIKLEHLLPGALNDARVILLSGKVSYKVDPLLKGTSGFVILNTKQGQFASATPEYVYGHPANPLTREAFIKKFTDCAAYAANPVPADNLRKFIDSILDLENAPAIGPLVSLLS